MHFKRLGKENPIRHMHLLSCVGGGKMRVVTFYGPADHPNN